MFFRSAQDLLLDGDPARTRTRDPSVTMEARHRQACDRGFAFFSQRGRWWRYFGVGVPADFMTLGTASGQKTKPELFDRWRPFWPVVNSNKVI